MKDWSKHYDAAAAEMKLAEEEYRIAEASLARATARRNAAEREFSRLFRERVNAVSADT